MIKYHNKAKTPLLFVISGIFGLLFPQFGSAQRVITPNYFGPVLEFSSGVSGNFGELRGNHFHSGIDYKTGEKEGVPVYAAAEGFISRVKISPRGYGKALYINHPNGTTTVYGHLRAFAEPIDSLIKLKQLENKEFELELFPKPEEFPVKANQIIGFSGNSGGSTGPHLHFEIRDTQSEKPFNPELGGYIIEDSISPILENIIVYQPGPSGGLQGCNRSIIQVYPESMDTIRVNDYIFLGFECYDLANNSSNKLGIRSFSLIVDNELKFRSTITEFAFDETRMINAFIDHPFKSETGRTVILCVLLSGNGWKYYEKTDGEIRLNHHQVANCVLKIEDGSGNFTEKKFILSGDTSIVNKSFIPNGEKLEFNQKLLLNEKKYRLNFKTGSFYEDVWIQHKSLEMYSPIFHSSLVSIDANNAAVQKPFELSIAVNANGNVDTNKLVIAILDSSGITAGPSSTYENGYLKSETRIMGNFIVVVDTSAPTIGLAYWKLDDYTGKDALIIPVIDQLSGIKKYDCYINDKWICGEYNEMRQEITLYGDELQNSGNLTITLTDQKKNTGTYRLMIDWNSKEIIQ